MTDTVADMIIRLKNGYMARRETVVVPASNLRQSIAELLVESGYVTSYERVAKQPQDELVLTLRYVDRKPSLTNVKRISKPGRRIYASADRLPVVLSGYGTTIISTSEGLLTAKAAKQKNIGGEILFSIW